MRGIRGTSTRAQALVLHIVHRVNGHLGPLEHILAVDLAPVADGFAAAGADGFQFFDRMRQFQLTCITSAPWLAASAVDWASSQPDHAP